MMNGIESYDILVFGGGKGGKTLAMDQARAGKKVGMIEAGMIGGSCINIACIPSKALIRSAEVAHTVHEAPAFGTLPGDTRTQMQRVAARTAEVVEGMVEINRRGFAASGLDLVLGWGRFVEPRVIEVRTETGPRRLTGDRIYLNLGSRADIPDVRGLADATPLTHVEALKLDVLPDHLVILGGGYIGMELGQAFRRLGAAVTIVEQGSRLAAREDEDVSAALLETLAAEGVDVVLGAGVASVSGRSGEAVTTQLTDGRTILGSHLLVAAGRQPMTRDVGLDIAGVALDRRGFIAVDKHLKTSADAIWAIGDCAGTPMFTHASLHDYRVIKSGISGGMRTTAGRIIPYCVFIDPELARVGLNETEARAAGIGYRLARLPMDMVPRARTLSQRKGFMKALVAADDDRILGFMMLGAQAGEIMTVVQTAMLGGLPFTALRDGILAHPTLAEGLNMLFAQVAAPVQSRRLPEKAVA